LNFTARDKWTALPKWFCDVTGIPRYFLRQVAFELRMAGLRVYNQTPGPRWRSRSIKRRVSLKLMFGCGDVRREGWIGIDCFSGPAVDLRLDLRRPLPFLNSSVDYCYSEHFLEHLYPEEARLHLKEVCRILKPGGIYRVVVPAGIRFAEKYLAGDAAFFALAHPWETRPIDAVFKIVNWSGEHRGIYDFDQLNFMAMEAGFKDARESSANQSAISELRIDRSEPQRVAESLDTELIKG
jgi:predicted SAM-dependent methyltransferase